MSALTRLYFSAVFILYLVSVSDANAQEKDSLYLYGQSPVAGELKSIAGGKIEFEVEGLDLSFIKVNKVITVRSSGGKFRVQLNGSDVTSVNRVLCGRDTGYVRLVKEMGDTLCVALSSISFLMKLDTIREAHWKFNAGAGYSFTRSSGIGRLNLNTASQYYGHRSSIYLNYSGIYTIDSNVVNRDREQLSLSSNYYLDKKWYVIGLLLYQRNRAQGLTRRIQEGLGFGYNVWSRFGKEAYLATGLVWNQEQSSRKLVRANSVEWPLLVRFNLYKFSKPELTLSVAEGFYKDLRNRQGIRLDGDIQFKVKIMSDLSFALQFYHSYDQVPLNPIGLKWDYGSVFSLQYEWN